jgi:hypothetical protein
VNVVEIVCLFSQIWPKNWHFPQHMRWNDVASKSKDESGLVEYILRYIVSYQAERIGRKAIGGCARLAGRDIISNR